MHRDAVQFMVGVLLTSIMLGSIWYTMPLLFAKTLSNNYLGIGLMISIVPLIEIIAAIPSGYYADSGFIKRIAFISMTALILTPLLFATNLELLDAMGVFFLAVGSGGIWIAETAYLANVISRREVRYIGYEFSLMAVGSVLGPGLGGFAYNSVGATDLALMEILLLAVASFIFIRTMMERIDPKRKNAPKLLKILRMEERAVRKLTKAMLLFLFITFIYGFLVYSVWLTIPLLTITGNVSILVGGVLTGIISLPYVIGNAFGGAIYRRGREKGVILYSMAVAVIALFAASVLLQKNVYSLIIILVSTLATSIANVMVFIVAVERGRKDVGEIAGLSIISTGVGGALGLIVTGATLPGYGLYVVAAIFTVLAVLFMLHINIAFKKFRL